jgi:hypothetical protein
MMDVLGPRELALFCFGELGPTAEALQPGLLRQQGGVNRRPDEIAGRLVPSVTQVKEEWRL